MVLIAVCQENTGNSHIAQNKETNGIHFGPVGKARKEFFYIIFVKLQESYQVPVISPDFQYFENFFF